MSVWQPGETIRLSHRRDPPRITPPGVNHLTDTRRPCTLCPCARISRWPSLRHSPLAPHPRNPNCANTGQRPPQQSQGGIVQCRGIHVESQGRSQGRVSAGIPRPVQFRHGIHRQLRHPGQLQRLQCVGHLQSVTARARRGVLCPASQNDVSVYKNLMFMSAEAITGRLDCGGQGVKDTVSKDRIRGMRIFDISDIANPKYVANVQTCRGSHTHTVLEDPKDRENVYIYVSGSSGIRPPTRWRDASTRRRARGRIRRGSASRSSRCRSRIRDRRRSSPPRIFNDLAAPAPRRGTGRHRRRQGGAGCRKAEGAFIVDFLRRARRSCCPGSSCSRCSTAS